MQVMVFLLQLVILVHLTLHFRVRMSQLFLEQTNSLLQLPQHPSPLIHHPTNHPIHHPTNHPIHHPTNHLIHHPTNHLIHHPTNHLFFLTDILQLTLLSVFALDLQLLNLHRFL